MAKRRRQPPPQQRTRQQTRQPPSQQRTRQHTRQPPSPQQQARRRAQAEQKRRRNRRRKRNLTLHYLLLLIFFVGAGAVLSFTVLFKIESVEVLGVDKYTPDEIAEASGIELQSNLLRVNKKAVSETLMEQFPYIASVEIRRKLPPGIEITVTQAEPAAAIIDGGDTVLITAEGKVLERGKLLLPEDLLVLKGIDASGVQPGETVGEYTPSELDGDEELAEEEVEKEETANETKEKLQMLQYLVAAMKESEFDQLTNLDLTDRLNMKVKYENRIVIELGSEAELTDKLTLIKHILEAYIDPAAEGTIYAAEIVEKRRVTFRQSTGSEDAQADIVLPVSEEGALPEGQESVDGS